jgi:hypothetical protein
MVVYSHTRRGSGQGPGGDSSSGRDGDRRLFNTACVQARAIALIVSITALIAVVPSLPVRAADPVDVSINATDSEGAGRITTPGTPCAAGGSGSHWHYDYRSALLPKSFGTLAGEVLVHLDVHSEDDGPRIDPGFAYDGFGKGAFLQGEESHATLASERGLVKLRLSSGDCEHTSLDFDGSTVKTRATEDGLGSWRVADGAGSFRDATGNGTFSLRADVTPGADNGLQLDLDGQIEILLPGLNAEVVGVYWGGLGTDYLRRQPTVVFSITNPGPGDAYGARLFGVTSPTPGVRTVKFKPQHLGDLLEGESELVEVKFKLGLLEPCEQVLLGCEFDATLDVETPDAIGRPRMQQTTVHVRAPDFPPPL